MAPTELKELKSQLDELLEKCFHQTERLTLGSPSPIGEEEGWVETTVHRLPRAEQGHCEEHVSPSPHR